MKLMSKILIAFTLLLGGISFYPQNVKAAENNSYAIVRTVYVEKTTNSNYSYHHLDNSLYYEIKITGEYSLVDGAINSPVLNADLVDFSTDDDTFQASVVSCSVSYTATTITAKVKVKYTRYGSTLGSTTKTIRVV